MNQALRLTGRGFSAILDIAPLGPTLVVQAKCNCEAIVDADEPGGFRLFLLSEQVESPYCWSVVNTERNEDFEASSVIAAVGVLPGR